MDKDVEKKPSAAESAGNEEFDFSELQGLACGPEGCAIPEDFYKNRKNKDTENDKD